MSNFVLYYNYSKALHRCRMLCPRFVTRRGGAFYIFD